MDCGSIAKTPLVEFNVGPCRDAHELGFLIGQRFSNIIGNRVATDQILQQQLLPFARTREAQPLLQALSKNNQERFPRYWDELLGTAAGSGVPVLHLLLLNFRKEIIPFLPKVVVADDCCDDDCSDILVVNDSMAIAAHNEDANVALIGHTYLLKVELPSGISFTAYTYAGELPSCAFGFNNYGLVFTLNSVPPCNEEILAGGIGRNFISRDLLEAANLEDAMNRIQSPNASVGHSYNLIDVRNRVIVNVETASDHRSSIQNVGKTPYFHANMYLHLQIRQLQDENSITRQRRATQISLSSEEEMLFLLGDFADEKYPIYMTGPNLHTLCTALIDLDKKTLFIIHGNPKKRQVSHKLQIL